KPPRVRLALEALDDRILPSVTEFLTPTANSQPFGMTRGPDGNLWFTESLAGKIGRITPAGVITEFSAGLSPGGQPLVITARPGPTATSGSPSRAPAGSVGSRPRG